MGKKNIPKHVDEEEVEEEDAEYQAELRAMQAAQAESRKGLEINDEDGLRASLNSVKLPFGNSGSDWLERLQHTTEQPIQAMVEDVHDDLQRELAFHDATLASVISCQKICEDIGEPHTRPNDYMAEMIKTDGHMKKVRAKLAGEAQAAAAAEERKKQRLAKKFGKQVQVQKEQAKVQERKKNVDQVTQWRKDRKKGLVDEGALDFDAGGNSFSAKKGNSKQKAQPINKKREFKNAKYGINAKAKAAAKRNSMDSAGDMSSFSLKKNRQLSSSMKMKTKGVGKNRPGKSSRQAKMLGGRR